MEPHTTPTVAVALGCGGARGMAHLHVIEALDVLGIVPSAVAGCSIGGIMGSALASGIEGREMREHALAAVSSHRRIASGLWAGRAGFRTGIFDLQGLIPAFLPSGVPITLEELKIPFEVVATDFHTGEEVAISSGAVVPGLAASASIPAVFRPVSREGRTLVDGGMSNPVPFDRLRGVADVVVAVDVIGLPPDRKRLPTSSEALYGGSQLLQRALVDAKRASWSPDVLLRPAVGGFKALEFHRAREVLDASSGLKEQAVRAIAEAIEAASRRAA